MSLEYCRRFAPSHVTPPKAMRPKASARGKARLFLPAATPPLGVVVTLPVPADTPPVGLVVAGSSVMAAVTTVPFGQVAVSNAEPIGAEVGTVSVVLNVPSELIPVDPRLAEKLPEDRLKFTVPPVAEAHNPETVNELPTFTT